MPADFKNRKILLGITGSIAAYKSPLIVRELVKAGAHVNVIMTPSAEYFVSKLVLSNLSRNPVVTQMFDQEMQSSGAWHIQLAHWCDAMLIAPTSATTISRIASGLCDSALSAVAIALPREKPLIISPAMDSDMWLHPATQRNLRTIYNDGAYIIPPEEGELASGLSGPGRLPEIGVILDNLREILKNPQDVSRARPSAAEDKDDFENELKAALERSIPSLQDAVDKDAFSAEMEMDRMRRADQYLAGKRVVISAGPTREKIDDVRYISNHSSGKMGYAIARRAREAGAEVTLVSGPVSLVPPKDVAVENVETAEDMHRAMRLAAMDADIVVMSAAVADYTPAHPKTGKIKKQEAGDRLAVEMTATVDILKELGDNKKPGQLLVGFALESENELEYGRKKLREKNCDMIIINSATKPDSGFGGDKNTITIVDRNGSEKPFPAMAKDECAAAILRHAVKLD
ncbi:MAG: bifunctional phosphopantothenoylcysteine decarboxylase/phosphopantothenate synthase [Candidatus Kapaibacterium sp.]